VSRTKPSKVFAMVYHPEQTEEGGVACQPPEVHRHFARARPTVRVALLNDWCKLRELCETQDGSFRSVTDTFFVGACSHGTFMANCIRRVCPIAELVIVRLNDTRREENQRFTISSCCKVCPVLSTPKRQHSQRQKEPSIRDPS
jgi:hypothetical protein